MVPLFGIHLKHVYLQESLATLSHSNWPFSKQAIHHWLLQKFPKGIQTKRHTGTWIGLSNEKARIILPAYVWISWFLFWRSAISIANSQIITWSDQFRLYSKEGACHNFKYLELHSRWITQQCDYKTCKFIVRAGPLLSWIQARIIKSSCHDSRLNKLSLAIIEFYSLIPLFALAQVGRFHYPNRCAS